MDATTRGASACAGCQTPLTYSGKGRPRLYCETCRPVATERDKRKANRLNKIAARQRAERKKLDKSASATGEFYFHGICLWCGKPEPFVATGENIGCSDACSRKLERQAWTHQRIVGYRSAEVYDYVPRGRVYRRDRGICQLCGVAVPPPDAVHHDNPNAGQLDHIKQVADGGDNTLDNVRLAHAACNNAIQSSYRSSRSRRRVAWHAKQKHDSDVVL